MILVIETDGNIKASFRPVDPETGLWIPVYDLDFGDLYKDQLWIGARRYLYMFMITDDLLRME